MNEVVNPNDTPSVVRRYTAPVATAVAEPAPTVQTPTSGQNLSSSGSLNSLLSPEQFTAQRTGTVDESAIREATRKSMQAAIDATNNYYDDLVRRENEEGSARLDKVRAVNVNAGLSGSNFATSQDLQQRDKNSASVRAIENERNLKTQEIFGKIDEIARAEIKAKKEEALGNADAYTKYLADAKTEAQGTMAQLAGAGINLTTLDPNRRAYLFKAAGYDNELGPLIFNSLKPKSAQLDYKYIEQMDGSTLAIAPDPNNPGQFIEHKIQGVGPDLGLVLEMIKKYPDAGIAPKDDLATASAKIQQSRIYKEQVRPPQGPQPNPIGDMIKLLELQKLQGEVQGTGPAAQQETQKKTDKLQSILDTANDMLSDKKLNSAVGTLSSKLPTMRGATADFERKYEQLRGLLTLDNIGLLKGVLSDADMKIIKEASTKLNLNMSEQGFKKELKSIADKAELALSKLNASNTPTTGTTSTGLNYTIEP